jgi:hypothetical protein
LAEVIHLDGGKDIQLSIEAEEDVEESAKLDKEDDLSTDQIRASKKVNSIATIESLHLKLSLLPYMLILLCKLVAMPILRSILSSNLALLEDDFIHGYWEGVVVFYLSTTNEGGLVLLSLH